MIVVSLVFDREERRMSGSLERESQIGRQLRELMQRGEDSVSLAEAALLIAASEYPGLDGQSYIQRLDEMAAAVRRHASQGGNPFDTIAEINRYLFEKEKFTGNSDDYYDPRNSFLNDVMDRKTGIPIMLSTIYLEIAGRLGFPLVGVGMPGHFLVKHPQLQILIDPFSQGRIVSEVECEQLMQKVLGESVPFHSSYLEGVSKLHTVTRMLNNLRSVYMDLRQFQKAHQITELILALHPDSSTDWRQKAAFLIEMRHYAAAAAALERYLELAPEAEDAIELKQTIVNLRKAMAQMN